MIVITSRRLLAVTLPVKLTNNNAGRGGSFWRSAKDRKAFEEMLRARGHVYTPLDFPVYVRITRVYAGREREWDYSSGLRGSAKELEDACVACGWLKDDGPAHIRGVVFDQRRGDESAVMIEMFEAARVETPVETRKKRKAVVA